MDYDLITTKSQIVTGLTEFCAFLDVGKAFIVRTNDFVGYNVRLWSGQPIDATTGIPLGTLASVRINRAFTDWFSIHRGLSPA